MIDKLSTVDGVKTLSAAMILGIAGIAIFPIVPLLVGAMVDHLELTPQQSGFVASADIIGMAIGSFIAATWIHKFDLRYSAKIALSTIVLTNLLCTMTTGFQELLGLRLLAGVAEGTCLALTYAILGASSKADRNYGFFIAAAMIYGAVNVYIASALTQKFGAFVYFLDLTIIAMIAGICVNSLPRSILAQVNETDTLGSNSQGLASPLNLGIFSLLTLNLVYFTGQGSLWAYLERIGVAHSITLEKISATLSLSLIAAVIGALIATAASSHISRAAAFGSSALVALFCVLFLIWNITDLTFLLAVCIWNFAINFSHPFLLGYMSSIDKSGRCVVVSAALQTSGMGIGPALASIVISGPMYFNVLLLGLGCFLLTVILFLPIILFHR